jgi:hypothetical protein
VLRGCAVAGEIVGLMAWDAALKVIAAPVSFSAVTINQPKTTPAAIWMMSFMGAQYGPEDRPEPAPDASHHV